MQFEYDEVVGNPPTPACLFSIARHEDFFKATEGVVPYQAPASGDASQAVAPLVYVEKLFKYCTILVRRKKAAKVGKLRGRSSGGAGQQRGCWVQLLRDGGD